MAHLPAYLQFDAAAAWRRSKSAAGTAQARRRANHDERLHAGSQRTKTGSPFERGANGASLSKTNEMSQLDIYGHGQRDNYRNSSWLLVGAIGFEPMTSTV